MIVRTPEPHTSDFVANQEPDALRKMSSPAWRELAVKVAGPPRRTALQARADYGRAAGQSKRRYRPWFTVWD